MAKKKRKKKAPAARRRGVGASERGRNLRERALAALTKRQQGEKISDADAAAIDKWREQVENEKRWEHYRAVPHEHMKKLGERPSNRLWLNMIANHDMPRDGGGEDPITYDLTRWIPWALGLAMDRSAPPPTDELQEMELERKRLHLDADRLDALERQGCLVSVEFARRVLDQWARLQRDATARIDRLLAMHLNRKQLAEIQEMRSDAQESQLDAVRSLIEEKGAAD